MGHCDELDRVHADLVKQQKREPSKHHSSIARVVVPNWPQARRTHHPGHCILDYAKELQTQPASSSIVPAHRLTNLVLGFRQNDAAQGDGAVVGLGHGRVSSSIKRARTSLQSLPRGRPRASRSSAAAERRWISPVHAAAHSGSGGPSTLSISSEASRSRSAGSSESASLATLENRRTLRS